jgi:hypothetical protein
LFQVLVFGEETCLGIKKYTTGMLQYNKTVLPIQQNGSSLKEIRPSRGLQVDTEFTNRLAIINVFPCLPDARIFKGSEIRVDS